MEALSSLSPDERQYEDLRYSPDDFDPDMPIRKDVFKRYFTMEATALIAGYKNEKRRVNPGLYHETRQPDLTVGGFSTMVRHRFGREVLTWGDFQWIIEEWTADWDERHGYNRSTIADSPSASEPTE